jgi:hypothetical protein
MGELENAEIITHITLAHKKENIKWKIIQLQFIKIYSRIEKVVFGLMEM